MSKKMKTKTADTVEILAPVLDMGPEVYCIRRLDLELSARQARALRLVFDGLQYAGETVRLPGLASQRPVSRPIDAIRYLLDQIADAASLE